MAIADQLVNQPVKIIWSSGVTGSDNMTFLGIENGLVWVQDTTVKYLRAISLVEIKEIHSIAPKV